MALTLKIEEILTNKAFMDYYVGFNRDESGKWIRLFENFDYENQDDLLKETNGGSMMDFEPFYTHIAKGEYGNCLLVLYRNGIYEEEDIETLKKSVSEGLSQQEQEAVLEELEFERYRVFGMYSYQYKGLIETEWFSALLKKEIEIKL